VSGCFVRVRAPKSLALACAVQRLNKRSKRQPRLNSIPRSARQLYGDQAQGAHAKDGDMVADLDLRATGFARRPRMTAPDLKRPGSKSRDATGSPPLDCLGTVLLRPEA